MALSFIPQQNDDPFASNRLKLAQAMMQQGSSTAPVSSHWEGLGRLAQALGGAYGVNKQKKEWETQQANDKVTADSMFDVLTRGDAKPEELKSAWGAMSPRNRSVFGPTIINEKMSERKEAFKRSQDQDERTRQIKAMHDAIDLDDSIPAPQKAAYKRAAEVDPKGFAGKYGSAEFRAPKNRQVTQTAEGVMERQDDGSWKRIGGTPSIAAANIRVENAPGAETWDMLDDERKTALGLPKDRAFEVSSRGSVRAVRGQPSAAGTALRPADQARIYQESLAKATKYANENSTANTNEQLQAEIQALAETYYNNTVNRVPGQTGAAPGAPGAVPGAMPERGPMYASADGTNAEGSAPKPTGPTGERKQKGLNANQQRLAIQNIEAQVVTEANAMQFDTPQAKAQWQRSEVERRSKEFALGPLPTAATLPPDGSGQPSAGPGFKLRDVPQTENSKMFDTINLLRVLKDTRTQSAQNPGSTGPMKGVINALPGGDTLNNIFDPNGQLTRAGVANLGSALLQARSGLAVTQAEFDRIKAMLPKVGDPQPVVRKALGNIEKEMKAVLQTHYSAYGPKGGYKANQEIETMLAGNAPTPPGPGAPPSPAATPTAPTAAPGSIDPRITKAKEAIASGRDPVVVKQMLQGMGLDPALVDQ